MSDLSKYARDREFRKIGATMPVLHFPATWGVQVIWPFGGAAARFVVTKGTHRVSVYADFDESLGYFGEPYWEVYPYHGDTWRCALAEGDELINAISVAIGQQEAEGIP
jgi:hypothetical protein